MTARDDILARLYASAREEPLPPAWETRRTLDDMPATFTQALTSVHGEVHQTQSLDEAINRLGTLLMQLDAKSIAMNPIPPLDRLDLPARWPNFAWYVAGQTAGSLRTFCQTADVGLSGAAAALAATGSVVIHSGPAQSRAVTLLPPVHIALVSTACLTADLFTWTAAQGGSTMPANVTLVSGPSKSADIEQTLTVGVHGPKRFIALLYKA